MSRVGNRSICARAVGFFDDQGLLNELTAVVFRFRDLYLLAPGGRTGHYFLIVDRQFRLLANLSPLQE